MSYSLGKYPFGHRREWPVIIQSRKRPSLGIVALLFFSMMVLSLILFAAGVVFLSGCAGDRLPATSPVGAVEEPAMPGLPPPTPRPQSALVLVPPPSLAKPPAPTGEVARRWRVPRNIVKGILATETRSVLRPDDTVRYVDKRRGAAGERGPTQIRKIAFEQVKKPGECFWQIEVDTEFALEITERYLLWLRHQTGSWREAIMAYNAGLGGRSGEAAHDYYVAVREKS